jgi:hypothetical protein
LAGFDPTVPRPPKYALGLPLRHYTDAFKKRTEVTHKIQSIEEVENELAETLNKLKRITNLSRQPVMDVQVKEIEKLPDEIDD